MELQVFRRSEIKRDELTAASIIEQYPMLITLPDILIKDFEFKIKVGGVSTMDRKAQWEKGAAFIASHGFAVQTPHNGIGQVIRAFNIFSMSDIDNLSTHEVGYLALCLLPHILQPRTVQGKERKRDRFSASTALSHLIQFAKATNSFQSI
uniref:Uncharacterized protein n=1 Tax=Plectus sambesii TaxID=2011161 RepID=A0A914UZ76_9BILA